MSRTALNVQVVVVASQTIDDKNGRRERGDGRLSYGMSVRQMGSEKLALIGWF